MRDAQRRPGREPRRHTDPRRRRLYSRCAQRRPGREPRRHRIRLRASMPRAVAQRRPGREPRRHRSGSARRRSSCPALNEGRGANPGDTLGVSLVIIVVLRRSTKAGARTPATRVHDRVLARAGVRSTKAGARTPATPPRRVVGRRDRLRSTKAGARTPATPRKPRSRARRSTPLNEGRGANPGDTGHARDAQGDRARSTKAGARTPATPSTWMPATL